MTKSSPVRHYDPIPAETDILAKRILDAAFKVHSALGPGLLESVYEACLAYEIRNSGASVETQVALPVIYERVRVEAGLRIDLLVSKSIIVEIKAVETMNPLHEAQLLTYLKLTSMRLGFLINFNVEHLKDGIKRLVI